MGFRENKQLGRSRIFPKIPGKTTRNAVLGGTFLMFSAGIKPGIKSGILGSSDPWEHLLVQIFFLK